MSLYATVNPKKIPTPPQLSEEKTNIVVIWSSSLWPPGLYNLGRDITVQTSLPVILILVYRVTRANAGNIRPSRVSGNISANDLQVCRTVCSVTVAAITDGARTRKEAGPARRSLRGAGHAGKENGSKLSSHCCLSLNLCLLLLWGADLLLAKSQRFKGGSSGCVQCASVSLIQQKAVSDFWVWFVTTSFRLQLLLFYFALQNLSLLSIHHYMMFYLYSQKLNTTLLFFRIECRFLGGLADGWKPLGPLEREIQSWKKEPVMILLYLQGGAYTYAAMESNFIIILFKDEWCWELEECLEEIN